MFLGLKSEKERQKDESDVNDIAVRNAAAKGDILKSSSEEEFVELQEDDDDELSEEEEVKSKTKTSRKDVRVIVT